MEVKGKKFVVLGVGNRMRGDDGAGSLLAEMIGGIDGGETPENYIWRVKDEKPDVVLIVDAIDMGVKPGKIAFLNPEKLERWRAISTHRIPLSLLAKVIKEETGADVLIIGIQPKSIRFGEGLSSEVEKALKILEDKLSFLQAMASSS